MDPAEQLRQAAEAALPPVEGKVTVPGLSAPVEVTRDRWGVPHIFAKSIDDLLLAQGFVVASERLFQIDFMLRMANGRLAEMVSALALPLDRFARSIGWNRAGARVASGWDEESRRIVAAYRAGVRAWVEAMPAPPIEYVALELEPNIPEDDASWGAAVVWMAWTLSGNWDEELLRAEVLDRLGADAVRDLFPKLPDVPTEVIAGTRPSGLDLLEAAPPRPRGQGSNNWAVAGSRTLSGKPLLANDPHLAMLVPSIWIEVHLAAPGYEAAGVALPFAPGVVIGHTAHHAWGFTNVAGDTQDLFVERLNEDRTAAEFAGAWEPLTIHREEIRVRGMDEPFVVEVPETRHGPILDAYMVGIAHPEVVEGGWTQSYALRWTGFERAIMPSTLLKVARATDFESFRDAVRGWETPGQNMVYADVDGTIGYQCTGSYPIRRAGDGTAPVPGWTGEFEWDGWVPFEELPWSKDPEGGVIATANNRIHGDEYPHHLGHDWSAPARARRIGELLAATQHHSTETMAAIQRDVVSIPARELSAVLASVEPAGERQRVAIALLDGWDGALHVDSAAACVYEAWCHAIAERALRPALGNRLYAHYYARRQSTSEWKAVVLPHLLANRSARWFGADGSAARDAVLRGALDSALDDLSARLGEDPSSWRWGDLQRVRFAHPLAMLPGLDRLLVAGEVSVGGDEDTVNVAHVEPEERFEVVALPSWRMIADLSDADASVGCHTTGQSGHPASPHWNDLLPLWATARHHPLPFTREAVAEASESAMALVPR